jgi:DNA-directed RNA polymerase sigma subunit (sigma70/sigma32)
MKTLEELNAMFKDSPNDRTLEEIGKELTITPEQAKELEKKHISKPKQNRKSIHKNLKKYVDS